MVAVALPLGPTPAALRAWIEAMERISMANRPARAKAAAEIKLDAAARRQALDPLDDPEFRAEAEAEARGWYGKPDATEVIEHLWAMQARMDAMTEAYQDACKRKGVDPPPETPFRLDGSDVAVLAADTSFARQFGCSGAPDVVAAPCSGVFMSRAESIAGVPSSLRARTCRSPRG